MCTLEVPPRARSRPRALSRARRSRPRPRRADASFVLCLSLSLAFARAGFARAFRFVSCHFIRPRRRRSVAEWMRSDLSRAR